MNVVEPVILQMSYEPPKEIELDLFVLGRCSECKKKIKITDIVNIDDQNIFMEIEPHNCEK